MRTIIGSAATRIVALALAATTSAAVAQSRYYARQSLGRGSTGTTAATGKPLADKVVANPPYMQLVANAIGNVAAFNTALGYYPSSLSEVTAAGYEKSTMSDDQGHRVWGTLWQPDGNAPLFTFTDGVSDADCAQFNASNGNGSVILPVKGAKPAYGCVRLSDGRNMPYFLVASASPNVSGYVKLIDDAAKGVAAYVAAKGAAPGSLYDSQPYAPGPMSSGAGTVWGTIWTPDGSPRLFTYTGGIPDDACRAVNASYGNGSVIQKSPAPTTNGCMVLSDGRNMPYHVVG